MSARLGQGPQPRAAKSDRQTELLAAMKKLRQAHDGVIWTGLLRNNVKVDGQYVTGERWRLELDEPTLLQVLAFLENMPGVDVDLGDVIAAPAPKRTQKKAAAK